LLQGYIINITNNNNNKESESMNAEELATVTEIIGSLGDNAVTGLTYYIGANLVTEFIAYGVGICAIFAGYKAVCKIGDMISANGRSELTLRNVRDTLGVGSSGYVSESETAQILNKINQLKSK